MTRSGLKTSNFSACCGKLLEIQQFVAAGRRQVVDIPPINPVITEYQIFSAQCTCGHKTTAAYPEGVQTPVSYGSNVQALVAYMSARQYMPVARMAEFFSSVLGLKISTGGVCYLLDKSKSKLALQYEYIRRFVLESPIIGADSLSRFTGKTGVNIKGKNHWAWVFQTHLASFFGIHKNRGIKAINELMPEGFNGSERAVRKFKVKQKVSGLFRSLDGAEIYATIMSVVDTAIKQGQSPSSELQKHLAIGATE